MSKTTHSEREVAYRLTSCPSPLVSGTRFTLQVIDCKMGHVVYAVDKEVRDLDLIQDPNTFLSLITEDLFMQVTKLIARDAAKNLVSTYWTATPPKPHNPTPATVAPKSTVPTPKDRVTNAYPIGTPILYRDGPGWAHGTVSHISEYLIEIRSRDDGSFFNMSFDDALYDLRVMSCYPLETRHGSMDSVQVQAEYRAAHSAHDEECPDCKGLGVIQLFTSSVPCDTCNGKGTV